MAHAREAIRAALVSAVTGLGTTGSNVFTMRAHALSEAELPAINVLVESEEVDTANSVMGGDDMRELSFTLDCVAKANTELANTLDDICSEVETALAGDSTLSGLTLTADYVGTDFELDDEGDQPVGIAHLGFLIRYNVDRTNP